MGDNLEFHKMTFCGLFIYCFIRIWKEILEIRDPQRLEFNPYFVENMAFALSYESLNKHQKNNLETEMWKYVWVEFR